ncbi:MAG: YqaE/Pmp3 family membrane protein [Hyphomicrobiaceae bacterium]
MNYLVAIFFPWLSFFFMGKVVQGIICLILQLTLIGWIPASIWAFMAISGHHADKRVAKLEKAIRNQ